MPSIGSRLDTSYHPKQSPPMPPHAALSPRRPAMVLIALAAGLLATPTWAAEKMGMTWAKAGHHDKLAIDAITCHGTDRSCDPHIGDTACSTALPVLCLKKDHSPRPNYFILPSGGDLPDAFYRGWAGGHIATTTPVAGSSLGSAAQADAFCQTAFGAGWRMAEFHDGRYISGMRHDRHYGNQRHWHSDSPWNEEATQAGGWAFWAYGNVRDDTRFWVRINDQKANCWN
jgi:hypothetical protein